MRTNTTIARTIFLLAAFAVGCADAPAVTGPNAKLLGAGLPTCVKGNAGTVDCTSVNSSLRPSASVVYDVQGQGSFTSYAQPTAEYLQGTTKIDISALTDLSYYNSISDAAQTVTFLHGSLQRRTVPLTWLTWSSPPESESDTPPVLYSQDPLHTALSLSVPAAVVGFELEPDPLGGEIVLLAEFYDEDYTLIGVIQRSVAGSAGARLFSFSTDWPKKISRVDISGLGVYFAIAQFRYGPTPLVPASTAIAIDIKPGTSPNDVHRSSKGRLPVVVLTTPAFDPANLDVASITLGDEAAQDTPVSQQNKGAPMASFKDVDSDGDLDLILQFDIPALVANGDLTSSTTQLVLKATRTDGGAVRGVDSVVVKP